MVTGSSGVLGRALVERLRGTGRHVIGMDSRVPSDCAPDRFVCGDVRDPRAVADAVAPGASVVLHCAAALPSNSAAEVASVDREGTRAVLSRADAVDVPRFVHVSSTAVYGLPEVTPTPEDAPFSAVDPYNRAKIDAELLCAAARDAGRRVAVLRPKTFLGPGRLGLFGMLFEWADEGHHFPVLGRADVRCQMLDVDDLADFTVSLLDADDETFDATYNVAATEYGTLREDFQAVLDRAGHGRRVVSLPVGAAVPVLSVLARLRLSPVYGRLIHKLTADSHVTTDRARAAGYRPRYGNRESLLRTFEWWLDNRSQIARLRPGTTHGAPWRQGALRVAKGVF